MAGATPQASATPQTSATPHVNGTLQTSEILPEAQVGAEFEVVEDDKSTFSYQEIANLLLIKKNPVFQAALDEWESKVKELGIRVNERKSQSVLLKSEIYNIVALFSVFLGVVLTAVSQLAANQTSGSTPLCGKIWTPILLTGFGTLFTCIGVLHKFVGLRALELSIQAGKQALKEAVHRALTLRRLGPKKFRFNRDASDSKLTKKPKTFGADIIFVISSILCITTSFVLSYFVIFCDYWIIQGWNRS